jgi:hypothetical protein
MEWVNSFPRQPEISRRVREIGASDGKRSSTGNGIPGCWHANEPWVRNSYRFDGDHGAFAEPVSSLILLMGRDRCAPFSSTESHRGDERPVGALARVPAVLDKALPMNLKTAVETPPE